MEICVHAGLHKSGTTTVQHAFMDAFGEPGAVWYPPSGSMIPNHIAYVMPYVSAIRAGAGTHVGIAAGASPDKTLSSLVTRAAGSGVEKLLISAESLDALADEDVDGFAAAFQGHPVRVLFTVTAPRHRWAAVWQEHVKHGLGASPALAAPIIRPAAHLMEGDLERLVRRFPAEHKILRLVSTQRHDPGLVASVASLLGVDWPGDAPAPENRNASLGATTVALAYLNGCGYTAGMLAGESVEILERALKDADGGRIDQYANADFEVPFDVDHAAIAERRFLEGVRDDGSVVVADPSGLLATWDSAGLPDWYEVAARESTGPGDRWTESEAVEVLWRMAFKWLAATAERDLARREAGRLEGELVVEREVHALTRRRLRRIRSELAAMRSSRTWRLVGGVGRVLGRR